MLREDETHTAAQLNLSCYGDDTPEVKERRWPEAAGV
jgi:hypothetical protein